MGKSAVLKDLSNRPGGYYYRTQEGIVCRAQLSMPAQAAIVFCDGSQKTVALSPDGVEQRFDCGGAEVAGVYVFQGENLLLFSDEAVRRAFDQEMRRRNAQASKQTEKAKEIPAQREMAAAEDGQLSLQCNARNREFPQRRWPPPPAWDTACYQHGSWQERKSPPD